MALLRSHLILHDPPLFANNSAFNNHGGWIEFVLLFLVPDLSMIGYAAKARVGAATYSAFAYLKLGHSPLAGYSVWTGQNSALLISLIWIARIGLDRNARVRV